MQTAEDFIAHLEKLPDQTAQRQLIEQEAPLLTDETVQQMKTRANELLGTDIERGLHLADNIIYASQVTGQPVHHALGLMVQANAAVLRGKHREAVLLYDQARETALAAGNELEAARSQVGKIGALSQLGEYQQALEVAEQVGPVMLKYNATLSAAGVFANAGICYAHLGQLEQSLAEYRKTQQILEEANTETANRQLPFILINISLSLRDQGNYHEALSYSSQAYQLADKFGFTLTKAESQFGAATCHYILGNYNKALRLLLDALEIFDKHNYVQKIIECQRFLVICYYMLGRYEEVIQQVKAATAFLEEHGLAQSFESVSMSARLGMTLLALNELKEAQLVLEQAQTQAEKLGLTFVVQEIQIMLAEVYSSIGQQEVAIALLKTLVLSATTQPQLIPRTQLLLARLSAGKEDFSEAFSWLEQALANFQNLQQPEGLFKVYQLLAEISERQGDLGKASGYIEQSLDQLESLRGRIASEARSSFLRSKEDVYESSVILTLNNEQLEQAFNQAERVKSRALVELVGQQLDVRIKVRDAADRPLVEAIEELRQHHNDLTSRLSRWQLPTSFSDLPELSQAEREKLLVEVEDCEKRLTQLTERLQVRNANYAEDLNLAPARRLFDRSLLNMDEVLIEYYVARGELLAFVVSRSGVQVVRNLTTVAQLNRQLSFFRLNLAGTVKNLADAAYADPQTHAVRQEGLINNSRALLQKLYNVLIGPLVPYLAGYNHLILVPHGPLHYLPFHALYNPACGCYLLEEFAEISYLPAASLLKFSRERAHQSHGEGALVLGFSNCGALPCTIEEAQQVAQTLGCEVYLEDEANLVRFRELASNKRILHLATHGRYREDAPLFSSLLLAQGELTGHEIFNMELQASLVTLSACDSGLGAIGGGDEVLGLSRACLYAGASSLALSLWRVDDRAGSVLMQEFYRNLLAGQGKAKALRQAQLTLLSNPDYRHPFYWSPFILIGDNGTL